MKKKFSGYWATFEFLDDLCGAIKELRSSGYKEITTHSPCPRHEIDHSLGDPQSRVPFFTLIFGMVGTVTAYTMANWMSVDWVLPVSSKPLVTFIPYTVIAFELTVLMGAYGTIVGMLFLIYKGTRAKTFPISKEYKEYNRFLNDRFGLVVSCDKGDFTKVEMLLKKYSAEEVYNEG
ncbi:MAG: DUF3341 domain-containing protein [SAR324 cluster bacterium]|nr:DUF3341 domain-containing protein [SAR324 cluster bacterium]